MAPSVHAYTAAMRAAAEGGRWRRALDIWDDMARADCRPTGAGSASSLLSIADVLLSALQHQLLMPH